MLCSKFDKCIMRRETHFPDAWLIILKGWIGIRFVFIGIASIYLSLLTFASTVFASPDFAPAVAEYARPAVVTIITKHGSGSGFIISPEGYLLTNQHVVGNAKTVKIILADKNEIDGIVIGSGPKDVALIRLDKKNLPTLRLGRGNTAKVGETVLMLGTPLGLENSSTKGSIGHANRRLDDGEYLQIDGWVNPGNSGGPVVNMRGEVIGIVTKTSRDARGIGFALPIEVAFEILDAHSVAVETALENERLYLKSKEKKPEPSKGNIEKPATNPETVNLFICAAIAGSLGCAAGWFICSRKKTRDIEVIFHNNQSKKCEEK